LRQAEGDPAKAAALFTEAADMFAAVGHPAGRSPLPRVGGRWLNKGSSNLTVCQNIGLMPATQGRQQVAAVEGWFSAEPEPHLIGKRCMACGTSVFPPLAARCPNPQCGGELEEAALSRRGRVWSFTINRYAPPPPYVADDPFEPFGVAAVELDEERMIVLGQVDGDATELAIGDEVELVIGELSDGALVWRWAKR
jgi:uncharacterized OB-fold protein